MEKNLDPLATSLNLAPLKEIEGEIIEAPDTTAKTEIVPVTDNNDYKAAKGNLENVFTIGTEAMKDVLDMAQTMADLRAYRVLNEMMATMVAASKTQMEIKTMQVEVEKGGPQEGPRVVHNNLNISTKELQELIAQRKV